MKLSLMAAKLVKSSRPILSCSILASLVVGVQSSATSYVDFDTTSTAAQIALEKAGLTNNTGGANSVYSLSESTGTLPSSAFTTVDKYIYDRETNTLMEFTYDMSIKHLSAPEGTVSDTTHYYQLSDEVTYDGKTATYLGDALGSFSYNLSVDVNSATNGLYVYEAGVTEIRQNFSNIYTKPETSAAVDLDGFACRIEDTTARINLIEGNFVGNHGQYQEIRGGLYVNAAHVESIKGSFIGNYAQAGQDSFYVATKIQEAWGAAIFLYGDTTVGTIEADFIGNKVSGAIQKTGTGHFTSSISAGGAITSSGKSIDTIKGDFISNQASTAISSATASVSFTGGGAIYNEDATIKSIIGDFHKNTATSFLVGTEGEYIGTLTAAGGAILNGSFYSGTSSIESITGDFIANGVEHRTVDGPNDICSVVGGAIANTEYKASLSTNPQPDLVIGDILGNFIGNYAINNATFRGSAHGGAIFQDTDGLIKSIVGDFVSNYTQAQASSQGGAIYNDEFSEITAISGDFIGNYASILPSVPGAVVPSATEGAGAIYNDKSTIGILANTRDLEITGNYYTLDGGVTKEFLGIINMGLYSETSELYPGESKSIVNLTAQGGYDIFVNDKIKGRTGITADDRSVTASIISVTTTGGSTVYINNNVYSQNIIVNADSHLVLGNYEAETFYLADGELLTKDASALLEHSQLNLSSGSLVETVADYLGSNNIINLGGLTSTIRFSSGSLQNSMNKEGLVVINANSQVSFDVTSNYSGITRLEKGSTLDVTADAAMGTSQAVMQGAVLDVHADVTVANSILAAYGENIISRESGDATAGIITGNITVGETPRGYIASLIPTPNYVPTLIVKDTALSGNTTNVTQGHSLKLQNTEVRANTTIAGASSGVSSYLLQSSAQLSNGATLNMKDLVIDARSTIVDGVNEGTLSLENTTLINMSVDNIQKEALFISLDEMLGQASGEELGTGDFYTLHTGFDVTTDIITESLTLHVNMSGADYDAFIADVLRDDLIMGFEVLGLENIGNWSHESLISDITKLYVNGVLLDTEVAYVDGQAILYLPAIAGIPEPSTATLSLLALAGLLARRRRKSA